MSEKETGVVKWFNDDKGFGFIAREGGEDIFVHYSAIESGNRRRTLHENDRVAFVVGKGKKGLQATEVTILED